MTMEQKKKKIKPLPWFPGKTNPTTIPKMVNGISGWLLTPKCWPAPWSTVKTDPLTQVLKIDLWMIFDLHQK